MTPEAADSDLLSPVRALIQAAPDPDRGAPAEVVIPDLVTVITDAGGAQAVAWVAPRDEAPMRRCRVSAPVAEDAQDDLPHWRELFSKAGFSMEGIGDDEDEEDAAASFLAAPPVQRVVLAEEAPRARPARRSIPVSIFDLASHPVGCRAWAAAQAPTTARRIERLEGGITRCINYPLTETAEWQERELQRRARQRPPRTGTRKVKKAIAHWGLFEGRPA